MQKVDKLGKEGEDFLQREGKGEGGRNEEKGQICREEKGKGELYNKVNVILRLVELLERKFTITPVKHKLTHHYNHLVNKISIFMIHPSFSLVEDVRV